MHFRSKHENIIQMQNNFFNVFSSKREVNMHKKKKQQHFLNNLCQRIAFGYWYSSHQLNYIFFIKIEDKKGSMVLNSLPTTYCIHLY